MATSASSISVIAERYASSLFELALEAKALDKVERDLAGFNDLVAGSADLTRLVRSPVFAADEQSKAVDAILKKAKIGGLAGNLVRVMARNRRLFAMPAVLGKYRNLLAAHRGEASADVTVAHPLAPKQKAELTKALKAIVGKDVAIHTSVDESILGGLIVKIGSRQIDTSLRTKLSSLKLALKEVG